MIVEEKTIDSTRVYTGKTISLKVDTVEVDNKGYQKREIVEHHGEVVVVAITNKNEVILTKQFRKSTEEIMWELPSERLEIGETPKDCAIRELKELTGYTTQNIRLIHKFFSSPGISTQKVYMYLATDVELEEYDLNCDRNIEIHNVNIEDAYKMVMNNDIEDAKTIVGILLTNQLNK